MQSNPEPYDPAAIEAATRKFWTERGLPPSSGSIGPVSGPRIHQVIGTLASESNRVALLQAGTIADADARYFAQSGRRSVGRFLMQSSQDSGPSEATLELLARAGVWAGSRRVDLDDPHADIEPLQRMLERLAVAGILVRRETPLRSCPRCRVPRTPAGIDYHEEEGPAYLVRFPLTGASPAASLLVWTDAVWKLLGAPAILAQSDAPYVLVQYGRRGSEERVVVSRSSLERLRGWLPVSTFEVLEEIGVGALEGRPYDHPLATESPMLARPPAPAGQVHLSPEVTDSGTGLVALVPAHGAADAAASRALDLPGWPVLDANLSLTASFRHKYQGLPLDAGESFVLRDLREGGYLFAQLTVRRGVPHCAVCQTPLVWETGSAWCLEPGQLPSERQELYSRLLPGEAAPPSTEVVPWPVSEREPVELPTAPQLRECNDCRRLAPPESGADCPCGGTTRLRRRRLLPVFRDALRAWAHETPLPPGEAIRLYLPSRRRVPTVLHHLVAMEAARAQPGDVRVVFLPTLPAAPAEEKFSEGWSMDSLRGALVSLSEAPRGGPEALAERGGQITLRLRRFWTLARMLSAGNRGESYADRARPIARRLPELLEEDRALLSLFEGVRAEALRRYEEGAHASAALALERFFDGPLRSQYLPAAFRRLAGPSAGQSKPAVFSVLGHILPTWAELYAPIAPFEMEAISRQFGPERLSLFERTHTPLLDALRDPKLEKRSERWWAIVEATRRVRRHLGVAEAAPLGHVVLSLSDDAEAAALNEDLPVIGRLANVNRLELASPAAPWAGRKLEVVPVLSVIQKTFGSGAPRVARILQGLPPQRVRDGVRSHSLEVAVEGRPVQVTPAMVQIAERLPEAFLTYPWASGELVVEVPREARAGSAGRPPALSADAYRLVRRLRRQVRGPPRPEAPKVAVVCASGVLGEELTRLAPALAAWLPIPLLRVVSATDGFPPSETITGKTGRGAPWALWVPGSRRGPARTHPRGERERLDRIRRAAARDRGPSPVDEFLAEPAVRRDTEINQWVLQLDELVGRPLVGPAKLRAAWDAGIQRYDDLVHAPFDRLSAVPGFGPIVAAELVRRFGGEVPTRPQPILPRVTLGSTSVAVDRVPSPPDFGTGSSVAPRPVPSREVGPGTASMAAVDVALSRAPRAPERPAPPPPGPGLAPFGSDGASSLPNSEVRGVADAPEPGPLASGVPAAPTGNEPADESSTRDTPPREILEIEPPAAAEPIVVTDLSETSTPAADESEPASEALPSEADAERAHLIALDDAELAHAPVDESAAPLGRASETGTASLSAQSAEVSSEIAPDETPFVGDASELAASPPETAVQDFELDRMGAPSPRTPLEGSADTPYPNPLPSPDPRSHGDSPETSPGTSPPVSPPVPSDGSIAEASPGARESAPGPTGPDAAGPHTPTALGSAEDAPPNAPLDGLAAVAVSDTAADSSPPTEPVPTHGSPLPDPPEVGVNAAIPPPQGSPSPENLPTEAPPTDPGTSAAEGVTVAEVVIPPASPDQEWRPSESESSGPTTPRLVLPIDDGPPSSAGNPEAGELLSPGAFGTGTEAAHSSETTPAEPSEGDHSADPEAGQLNPPPTPLDVVDLPDPVSLPLERVADPPSDIVLETSRIPPLLEPSGETVNPPTATSGDRVADPETSFAPGPEGSESSATGPVPRVEVDAPADPTAAPVSTTEREAAVTIAPEPADRRPPVQEVGGNSPAVTVSTDDAPSAPGENATRNLPQEGAPESSLAPLEVPPPPTTTSLDPTLAPAPWTSESALPLPPAGPPPQPEIELPHDDVRSDPVSPLIEPPVAAELLVTPIAPEVIEPPAPPPAPPSGLAVSSAAIANDAWPLFLDATGAGHRGLCISREFPDRMRALLGPRDVTICWLSNASRTGAVRPTDLALLAQVIDEALSQHAVRALYIDHVEYLIRVNSLAAVLAFLHRVDELARQHEARAWVALNPSLLSVADAEELSGAFPSAH